MMPVFDVFGKLRQDLEVILGCIVSSKLIRDTVLDSRVSYLVSSVLKWFLSVWGTMTPGPYVFFTSHVTSLAMGI